jgi:hypothetical protein
MDTFKNFAKVTVSTGYDAAATSIALTAGHGTKLPAAPFNATYWNSTDYPDPSDDPNVEIVRVTAIASDTLTVTRAQESTSASTKNTASKTYKMIAGLTAKTLNTDVGGSIPDVANGRLTLESGVPISTTNQSAKTTIYFTPHRGNHVSLYDTFTETSLALGTLTANTNYDVFLYSNAGTLTLELGSAWATATTRTDAITLQDGIYVKSGAMTRRYLGTFRTTSTTTTEDTLTKRFLWSYQNRALRDMYISDNTTHNYNGPFRQWNGVATNQVEFVTGLAEDTLMIAVFGAASTATSSTFAVTAAGLDSTTVPYRSAQVHGWNSTAGAITVATASGTVVSPQIGYHFIAALDDSENSGSPSFQEFRLSVGFLC